MSTSIETIAKWGWDTNYKLSNGTLDLIITGEVGPRILHFGFVDQPNHFANFDEQLGQTGGDNWRNYGGHRLWHAPEHPTRTYAPDNEPIQIETPDGIDCRIVQPIDPLTGIQKEIDITFIADNQVEVIHRMRNTTAWDITLSVWALSVMTYGGTAIVPLPPYKSHRESLLPTNHLTLWAYTDLSDDRFTLGGRYILLRQAERDTPQKFGVPGSQEWVAYANHGQLFVKTYQHDPQGTYPDMGCGVEIFTNHRMLEVETLSPLQTLAPYGGVAEHREVWALYDDVTVPQQDDDVQAIMIQHPIFRA